MPLIKGIKKPDYPKIINTFIKFMIIYYCVYQIGLGYCKLVDQSNNKFNLFQINFQPNLNQKVGDNFKYFIST